ncbi:hypothetical protein H5410_056317 [Solanum commersonii]|uniref:Uncharacterized protein n=1 Tax=Solanum commersonii TaxID=4109 RepID=A0A9J5WLT4_SOLCO|nr:hypothetical protein H5410_056317 [Solanum commersonii]
MDNKPLNQNFLDKEVMDDEFEKVNESAFNQLCQSLENEGMVNSQFRSVYLLKKEHAPSFFQKLVYNFFRDARFVIRNLIKTLYVFSLLF